MAGITKTQAETQLAKWIAADAKVAAGQSYSIGERTLTRANAREIRENIEYWDRQVRRLVPFRQENCEACPVMSDQKNTSGAVVAPANLADRVVGYFAPEKAVSRMRARSIMALSGGYDGAGSKRSGLFGWHPSNRDADGAALKDLPKLRARSHDLVRNAPLATGAISTATTSVVGTGIRPHPNVNTKVLGLDRNQAAEVNGILRALWDTWAESEECDITRTQNFYGLQDLMFRSALEAGDVLAVKRFRERPGAPFGLKVQVVEADRLSNPDRVRDSERLKAGVEYDVDGAPAAYFVSDKHPGDGFTRGGMTWTRVPAFGERSGMRQVIHLFDRLRPGQSRGVPYLAPVIGVLKDLTRYSEAEITAAVINSCFAVTVKADNEEAIELTNSNSTDGKGDTIELVDPGTSVILDLNETIEGFSSDRPNSGFDPFVVSLLRQVGAALEIPFELLIKHFTASYSASRAALLELWKFVRKRRAWLAGKACQPFYEALVVEAVARQAITLPRFIEDPFVRAAWLRCQWIGDAAGQLDPLKETKAARERIDGRLSTHDQEIGQLSGGNFENVTDQLAYEIDRQTDAGLVALPSIGSSEASTLDQDQTELLEN